MKPSEFFQYVVAITIVGLILVLLLSQLLGQPVIVFVETGSMEPTLEPNDGYIAVPSFFVGDIEEDDVILFDAQELGDGGGLTTHRVVDETEDGYITQGDANPFLDQDGDEPPVADGQVRSVAVQVGGDMVVIPGLGATVASVTSIGEGFIDRVLSPLGLDIDVSTLSTAVLIVGLLLFVYSSVTGSVGKRVRSRSHGSVFQNAVVLIAVLTLVVIIPVNFSMLLPSGVYQYEILSSTSPTADEQIIEAGTSGEVTYQMINSGHLPMLVFLEPAGSGVEVHESQHYLPRRTTVETSVTMHAPEETGTHLRFIREHRYLVVLPPSLIASLHEVHPLAAMGAINLTVAAVVISIAVGTVGTDRIRLRSRKRELSIEQELRRLIPPLTVHGSRDGRSGPQPPPERPRPPGDGSGPHPSAGASPLSRLRDRDPSDDRSDPRPEEPGGEFSDAEDLNGGVTDGEGPDNGTSEGAPSSANEADVESTATGFEAFESAVDDPDRLSDRQLIDVHTTLQRSPGEADFEGPSESDSSADGRPDRWTPELLRAYLRVTYDLEYSLDECAELMRRSGLDTDNDDANADTDPSR